jgi:hypothetical protein
MLDSLLTITWSAAAWLVGAFLLAVLADRAITVMTGTQEPIFLVIAVALLAALVVTSAYTVGKWIWHRLGGGSSSPKA